MGKPNNPDPHGHEPRHVGQGLAGVNIEPDKLSPEARQAYDDYQAICNDDAPGAGHENALRNAEHKLRAAIYADNLRQHETENQSS